MRNPPLSDLERWRNLCDALAEDALHAEHGQAKEAFVQSGLPERKPVAVAIAANKPWRRLTFTKALAAGVAIAFLGSVLAWMALHRNPALPPRVTILKVDDSPLVDKGVITFLRGSPISTQEVSGQLKSSLEKAGIAAATPKTSTYNVSVQIADIRVPSRRKRPIGSALPGVIRPLAEIVLHFSLTDAKTGAVIRTGDVTAERLVPQPNTASEHEALELAAGEASEKLATIVKEQIQPKKPAPKKGS